MDIRQLIAALTVYQTGNFSEAADQLAFTQSAVSKQINALEDELGVRIFDRGVQKQHVTPTREGEEILNKIHRMIDSYNDIVSYIEKKENESTPTVSVGSVNSFGECGDITLMARFIEAHPEFKVLNVVKHSVQLTELLKFRYIDCLTMFVSTTTLWPMQSFINYLSDNDAAGIPIMRGGLTVGVNKEHRFYNRESIKLEDLDGEVIIAKGDGPTKSFTKKKYADIVALCSDVGAHPVVKYVDDYSGRLRPKLAANGVGVMINSSRITLPYRDLKWIEVEDFPYPITSYFVYLKSNTNPALKALADMAKDMSREAGFKRLDCKNY